MQDPMSLIKANQEDLIKQVTSTRIDLDMLYHQLKERETTYNGLEAANSVILAKAWLGEVLGILGSETPYKPVTEVKDIPKTEHSSLFIRKTNEDRLIYLNECRSEILRIIAKTNTWNIKDKELVYHVNQCIVRLVEAKFHLGFELGILRDSIIKVMINLE